MNAPMMLLLAYIIVGHPEWRRAEIQLFVCFDSRDAEREADRLSAWMREGRLPISAQNVTSVSSSNGKMFEEEVSQYSSQADLVIAGLVTENLEPGVVTQALQQYKGANDVLFVHSMERVAID